MWTWLSSQSVLWPVDRWAAEVCPVFNVKCLFSLYCISVSRPVHSLLHWTVYVTLLNVFAENISKCLRHTSCIQDGLGVRINTWNSSWLRGETFTNQKEVQLSSLRHLGLPWPGSLRIYMLQSVNFSTASRFYAKLAFSGLLVTF